MPLIQEHYWEAIAAGNFSFGLPVSGWAVVLLALLVVAVAVFSYRRTTRPITRGWKAGLISLRAAALALLLMLLLEPGVLISEVEPQETYVAVLVDDSQSMGIRDLSGERSRHQEAVDLLYGGGAIAEGLAETFQLRHYRFSDVAERLPGPEALEHGGERSDLGAALNQVANELSGYPLAGIVLVSDGADNSGEEGVVEAGASLPGEPPLYNVALGREQLERDLGIVSVESDRALLEDSIYRIRAMVSQSGYAGERATLRIQDADDEVVAEQEVRLPEDGEAKRYTLELEPTERDILVYHMSLAEKSGEIIAENNHHDFFVDNRPKEPLDVLYVEGQPRNEYKFIRRAAEQDDSIRLATYLQTGPRKFLRQGIENTDELGDGFPHNAEALFRYEAVLLGNVEESFFEPEQLSLLQDFVGERGGGFLMVGGLSESFIDTPVEDLLPVEMVHESRLPSNLQGGPRRGDHPTGREFQPSITSEGQYSPVLRLDSSDSANRERWRDMPSLQGAYVTGRPKSGATVLMEHPSLAYRGAALPILSQQRYGAGRSMMLATASTWRWQMMLPHDDDSHERLWRQKLRWLTTEAPRRLTLDLDRDQYDTGETVDLRARLLSADYEPDNNGLLWAEIRDPDGETREVSLDWQVDKPGSYGTRIQVEKQGIHDLTVRVPSDIEGDLEARAPLLVRPSRREFLEAEMDSGVMRRLADNSGGRYYTADTAGDLVQDLSYSPNAYSNREWRSLWDQPLFLYLLIAFASVEWLARRYKGLS